MRRKTFMPARCAGPYIVLSSQHVSTSTAVAPTPAARGLHSFTLQLNLSNSWTRS